MVYLLGNRKKYILKSIQTVVEKNDTIALSGMVIYNNARTGNWNNFQDFIGTVLNFGTSKKKKKKTKRFPVQLKFVQQIRIVINQQYVTGGDVFIQYSNLYVEHNINVGTP